MAGRAGIGEGDRPKRPYCEGEFGGFELLKDDLLDEGLSIGGGGNMDADGVLAMDAAGVKSGLLPPYWLPDVEPSSLCSLYVDSASLTTESARSDLGRAGPCVLGVRL